MCSIEVKFLLVELVSEVIVWVMMKLWLLNVLVGFLLELFLC